MEDHLGYEKSERSDNDDYRNGYKSKTVKSSIGEVEFQVPQNRKATFELQVVKKGQKAISDIDHKIISIYVKEMTTRQISDPIEDIYGFDVSEVFISDVTDKILPQIEEWQNLSLDGVLAPCENNNFDFFRLTRTTYIYIKDKLKCQITTNSFQN